MIENPQDPALPGVARATGPVATALDGPERRSALLWGDQDPITDWLLERDDLDAAEFSVLFGVHKLRARPGRAGWIGHGELGRSTGLGPAELGDVLKRLCRRGLLGMVRHPVKSGCARYMLIVQG